MLGDALNTTVTVISTLQAELVSYSAIQTTYLLLVGIAAQAVGIGAFWWLQRRFNLSAHVMFNAVAVAIVLLDIWGMIGIWTNKFGFHNVWETWAVSGVLVRLRASRADPCDSIRHSTAFLSVRGTRIARS